MPRTVIIGGGIIGSCTAYFLAGDNDVIVLEKDPSYQYASTTLSAASIRTQFSLPLNVRDPTAPKRCAATIGCSLPRVRRLR